MRANYETVQHRSRGASFGPAASEARSAAPTSRCTALTGATLRQCLGGRSETSAPSAGSSHGLVVRSSLLAIECLAGGAGIARLAPRRISAERRQPGCNDGGPFWAPPCGAHCPSSTRRGSQIFPWDRVGPLGDASRRRWYRQRPSQGVRQLACSPRPRLGRVRSKAAFADHQGRLRDARQSRFCLS